MVDAALKSSRLTLHHHTVKRAVIECERLVT